MPGVIGRQTNVVVHSNSVQTQWRRFVTELYKEESAVLVILVADRGFRYGCHNTEWLAGWLATSVRRTD
jgi:hypothetical protein